MTSKYEMKYREEQAKRGLKKVNVWVPESQVEEIKEVAAKMRATRISTHQSPHKDTK